MTLSSRRALLALAAAAPLAARADGGAPGPCPPEACPTYAVTALANAALARQYGTPRGRPLVLSDADLFLARITESRRAAAEAAAVLGRGGRAAEPWALAGGWPKDDLDFLLARGARTRESLPWEALWRRRGADAARAALPGGGEAALARPESPGAFLERLRSEEAEKAARPETGEAALARQEREWVKGLLAGFRPRAASFRLNAAVLGPAFYRDREVCRSRGAEALAFALAELEAGRPVALALNAAGLEPWGSARATAPDWRAVLATGSARDADGRVVLATRAPDGAPGPALAEHDLCRVGQALSLLAPGDAAAP